MIGFVITSLSHTFILVIIRVSPTLNGSKKNEHFQDVKQNHLKAKFNQLLQVKRELTTI